MDNNSKGKKPQFGSGSNRFAAALIKNARAKGQQHRFPLPKKDEYKPFNGFKDCL